MTTRGRRARGGHDRGGAGETGLVIMVIGAVTVGVVVRQKVLVQGIPVNMTSVLQS
jgi:hypothetical protein